MSRLSPLDEDVRRLAQASAWRVALAEADVETSPEFELWLADPANGAAWDEVQGGWAAIGAYAGSPELLALRRDALARAQREGRPHWSPFTAPGWRAAIAACLLVFLGFGLYWSVSAWQARPLDYATMLGERRVLTMADGSHISLDSNSQVRVRYSDEARTIELVRGQARFDVARDVTRRFLVRARDQTIVATGTAFNVDLIGERVLVTLIEGHVTVLRGDGRPQAATSRGRFPRVALRAGQQLVAAPAAAPVVQTVSLERTTAWESGQLVFDDEPLAAIAERISRYAAHPVRVEPGAAAQRISGVFRAGDTATFVDTVTRYLPVRAAETQDGTIVLRPAG